MNPHRSLHGLVLAGGSYEPALPGLPDPGATVGWGAPVTRLLASTSSTPRSPT